jgi:ABC-type phosphate transport system auxiliary subunit
MHFHNIQGRKLVDINNGLYRLPLVEAIATIESIALRHKRIWMDPELDSAQRQQIDTQIGKLRLRHRRIEMLCRAAGAAAILLLILSALSSMQ